MCHILILCSFSTSVLSVLSVCVQYFQRYGLLKTSVHTGQVLQQQHSGCIAHQHLSCLLTHFWSTNFLDFLQVTCLVCVDYKSLHGYHEKKKDRFFACFYCHPPSLHRQISPKASVLCWLSSQCFWVGIKIVLIINDTTIFLFKSVGLNRQNNLVFHLWRFENTYAMRPNCLPWCSSMTACEQKSLPSLFG